MTLSTDRLGGDSGRRVPWIGPRRPTAILLGLLLVACAVEATPEGVYFPRRSEPSDGTSMAALLPGTLIERDGCIFVEFTTPTPSGRERTMLTLVIWPHESRVARGEDGVLVVTGQSGNTLRVGSQVELGGGFIGEAPTRDGPPEIVVVEPIPARCEASGYFLTAEPT